jgi:Icc-related predicted phosphoesterase
MNEKQYNNMIKKIAKIMSLESKVNIVGSAKIKRSIYYSDYDSFSTVKGKNENMIYNHFKSVFEIIKNSENTIISDFKMGEFRGKALRWDYEAIKRRENNGITFEDALKQKSMIKMDVVTLLNGRFIEITEVYNIYIDGESNFDYSKENVRKELNNDMKEQIKDGNYMKALKRKYSLLNLDNKNKAVREKLIDYFNSPIGLLNRSKSDLETMLTVIQSPKFDIDEIRNSLQMLKEQISAFPVENNLEEISKIKTKQNMKVPIYKQILRLKEFINKNAENMFRQKF